MAKKKIEKIEEISPKVLEKWANLIQATKNYYIDCIPTGISDSVYDSWERQAWEEDGFDSRDYVFRTWLPQGTKTKNKDVDKISKLKVEGPSMYQAISDTIKGIGGGYANLKYDGTSLALYLDPKNGVPLRIVTVGNTKIGDFGVDQTSKLLHLMPPQFPLGIKTIQMEALVDTESLKELEGSDPYRARQLANGLINSKYKADEIDQFLTFRAYRWWVDESIPQGRAFSRLDYATALSFLPTTRDKKTGRVIFAPADAWTLEELATLPGYTETDKTVTPTGTFLNDGWVIYSPTGTCWGALKFSGAGSDTEIPTTTVLGLQWNDQSGKGKDSWSANVLIEPITLRGCTVKKPSAGSVSKLVKNNITPGAKVKVILANSTIPMVGDVVSGGNGDYQFPKCSCGYQMTSLDIYGSNLKCGNPECTSRGERMKKYLEGLTSITHLDLGKFLVIDRFKWENTGISIDQVLDCVVNDQQEKLRNYLRKEMTTLLQQRNFDLVFPMAWKTLRENFLKSLL